jgi:very-short-patch-repair endonuclease
VSQKKTIYQALIEMNKSQVTQRARELRKNQTPSESLLWSNLRNRGLKGVKFFRQHPIVYEDNNGKLLSFYPDFYSNEKKLVIELDGKVHDFQKEYDKNRDEVLKMLGLKVVRIKNEELDNMAAVLEKIKSCF